MTLDILMAFLFGMMATCMILAGIALMWTMRGSE